MGFFRSFLGDDRPPNRQPIDSGALLRNATSEKATGNINGAIELLKQFWEEEPFVSSGYGVEAYLKLPMYLQQAGRGDEAWRTLKILLSDYVLSSAKLNEQTLPMARSDIYDKMRLFWQREGEAQAAIKYGILSHIHWLLGLHYQRRREELRECANRETIEAVVKPLLKKAKSLQYATTICDLVESEVSNIPNVDETSLGVAIDQLVLGALTSSSRKRLT
jgi:hypothetical protein